MNLSSTTPADYYGGFGERLGTSANRHPANLCRCALIERALKKLPHDNDRLAGLGCGKAPGS